MNWVRETKGNCRCEAVFLDRGLCPQGYNLNTDYISP